MSFFSNLLAMFKHKPEPAVRRAAPGGTSYMTAGAANTAPVPKKNKNVYDEGRRVPVPEWAEGLNNTELVSELRNHVKCKFQPNFGWKRIMTTQTGPDGNLIPEYDGIAGDCGAIKTFSAKIAKRDGRSMPYKYVDLNMAYRCCCDIPTKCPFFLMAKQEHDAINAHRK